ncbi:hypothetical protein RXX31_22130, partial [Vibrio sp. EA2]|nr:hypothetical protein [Vibrio sp. EA2]
VLGMVLVMVLLLAKQIITLYHAVQKILTKDQHALGPVDLSYRQITQQYFGSHIIVNESAIIAE